MSTAETYWINGPVLRAKMHGPFQMREAVTVGEQGLAGEVIRLHDDTVTIQVFEDTTGLRPGTPITGSTLPLAIELGPGMLGSIFDGLQRPLQAIARKKGDFIDSGVAVPRLDRHRKWPFLPRIRPGDRLAPGTIIGEVEETESLLNQILVPPGVAGVCRSVVAAGSYTINTPLVTIDDAGHKHSLTMLQDWPIRTPRPYSHRSIPTQPLLTGQRILDTFFPVSKGGTAIVPGGFGTGKTVIQHTLAKWSDADVIVYIGCGERGNEMASMIKDFPKLEDPRTERRLMERTIIIANTSNMPVAAREASIYTGITIAEYYRDQGMHVALLADSLSRWAEALREISGRLEELPAEEGYPAYLPTRMADFFERAGHVVTLSGVTASVTAIGAVSPPGGDFSEPVTSHGRRFARCLWALDRERARARFFPAVHPLNSYSGYVNEVADWWQQHGGLRWHQRRETMLSILQEQVRLEKMVRIIGRDALAAEQRLTLFCADLINEAILRQSPYSVTDRFCAPEKQVGILNLIDRFIHLAKGALKKGIEPEALAALPIVHKLQRVSEEVTNEQMESLSQLAHELEAAFTHLLDSRRATAS